MRLRAGQGARGKVVDLDTGLTVRKVIWLEFEQPGATEGPGTLEAYKVDSDGSISKDASGDYLTYVARGRFRWVREGAPEAVGHPLTGGQADTRVRLGAPSCARCRSPLTLPGDDLCARCNARDRGYKLSALPALSSLADSPLAAGPCAHRGCNRLGTYSVADEAPASSVVGDVAGVGRFAFRRGMTVGRRWYCPWHWQPPRLLDAKGEVVQELDDGCGVRPT